MGWNNSVGLLCLLFVGLSPLGHCTPLGGEGRPKLGDVLTRNTQESLEGREKPETKARPGKLIVGLDGSARRDYSDIPESSGNGSRSESGYQSDQADWSELQRLQGSVYGFGVPRSPAVQQLLGMRPEVECEDDAMTLKVHGGTGSFAYGLLIDRGSVPPLPLSRVPLECGLHVQKSRRGSVVVIPYDGCYVAHERDAYILPLRLWGLPAKMYCPSLPRAPSSPSVSCYPNGMVVKTPNIATVEDLWVKVENDWKPLLKASSECGFSVVSHSEGVVISAPYKPCMVAKDGVYSFHMAAESDFKLFCPSLVPHLPLNLSRPVSKDQSVNIDAITPAKLMPTDASPFPARRPTTWPWFGRPQPFKPGPALRPQLVPSKSGWTDVLPTLVPKTTASTAKPQKVNQIHYPYLPVAGYPFYVLKQPTAEPMHEVPGLTPKPKPVAVGQAYTKKPGKPTRPASGSVPTSVPAPSSKVEAPSFVGKTSFYPVVTQMLPGFVISEGSPHDQYQHSQSPGILPTAVPSKSSGPSEIGGEMGSPYQAVFGQGPWWPSPPLYLQRPAAVPTAAPTRPPKGSPYQAVQQMLPGSVFVHAPHLNYPQKPAVLPTAVPSKSSGTSKIGVEMGSPYQAVFGQGPWWPSPPLYLQRPAAVPTAAPTRPPKGSPYQAVQQMLPGSVFVHAPHLNYPQRPAVLPTAAPSKPLEASGVLGEAGSSYQAVPQMSKTIGYSECCPSTALYSNCCPPSLSYHQHNHHHFGFPYSVFSHGAAAGSATLGNSATQPLTMQATGHYHHPGALPVKDVAAAKPTESPSGRHDVPTKPTVSPQTRLKSFIQSTKRPWAGQVPPVLSSSYKPTASVPFAHQHKPKPPPNTSQYSPEYSKKPTPIQHLNVGHAPEEKHHPLPASRQTNPEPFVFLPPKGSLLNYKDPDDVFSPNFYDQSLLYSQAKFPAAVGEPYSLEHEPQRVDHELLELKQTYSLGSGPSTSLKAPSHEQVLGAHGQLSYAPSSHHLTEDLAASHWQVLTGPFSERWVPVVQAKRGEQAEFFDPLSQLSLPDYQPHGPV